MVETYPNNVEIVSSTNLLSNKYERDKINISKKNLKKIIKNKYKKIFIQKNLYINKSPYVINFLFKRKEFLKLKKSKGKTKNYLRINLNKIEKYEVEKIKYELEEYEREVA